MLIDRHTKLREMFCGGMNMGSVNLAEFMPYLHALSWYHSTHGQERLALRGFLDVHIVTDSRVIALGGLAACNLTKPLPKTHRALWTAMRTFVGQGYRIQFHWAPRSTTLLNACCDLLASLGRLGIQRAQHKELSPVLLRRLQHIERIGRETLQTPGADLRAGLESALYGLQALLDCHGATGDFTARAIESIKLTDPTTGQEINLHDLNHDLPET